MAFMQAAPEHGIVLCSTINTEYTSVQLEYAHPVSARRAPVLQLHVAHPRVLLLMRFVNDLLYAAEVVQVRASPDHHTCSQREAVQNQTRVKSQL